MCQLQSAEAKSLASAAEIINTTIINHYYYYYYYVQPQTQLEQTGCCGFLPQGKWIAFYHEQSFIHLLIRKHEVKFMQGV